MLNFWNFLVLFCLRAISWRSTWIGKDWPRNLIYFNPKQRKTEFLIIDSKFLESSRRVNKYRYRVSWKNNGWYEQTNLSVENGKLFPIAFPTDFPKNKKKVSPRSQGCVRKPVLNCFVNSVKDCELSRWSYTKTGSLVIRFFALHKLWIFSFFLKRSATERLRHFSGFPYGSSPPATNRSSQKSDWTNALCTVIDLTKWSFR